MDFTTATLRQEMFAVLRDLRNGKVTPQAAIASAKVVGVIIASARADMEAARFLSDVQKQQDGDRSVVVPLRLGAAA